MISFGMNLTSPPCSIPYCTYASADVSASLTPPSGATVSHTGESTLQAKKPANQRTGSRGASAGGGGPAAQAGMGFQNRAAAWVAAHILAEQAASPPWDLSAATTLDFVRCETEQPVDDLLVGTSEGGFVFVQAKHSLRLEVGADSALASAVDQFVRQFVVSQSATPGRPWERPLSPDRDRLVLLIGPHSSAPIRENLPSALRAKSQALASGYPTQAIVLNKELTIILSNPSLTNGE